MKKRTQLKLAMKEAGVNNRWMADQLNVSASRFSQILNGASINERQLILICKILNISADSIIFNYEPKGETPIESEYIYLFRSKLNDKARLRLIQMLREL